MTVAYVKEHIGALHGQTIRRRGEINNCTSLTCSICDGPGEADACLGLDLFTDSPEAQDTVEELYRFATVTLEARIDASCEVNYDPDIFKSKTEAEEAARKGDRDIIVVCTDRASSVLDAHVVSVEARKPASLGRFDMYKGEPLQEADAAAYDKMRKLLASLAWAEPSDEHDIKVYLEPEPWDGQVEAYYICECTEDDCTGRWPTWSGHTYTRSPANPYSCSYANRVGDNWIITP